MAFTRITAFEMQSDMKLNIIYLIKTHTQCIVKINIKL